MKLINEEARKGGVIDTLHGTAVADPYRSLELDSPGTHKWIDAQMARTTTWLKAAERPEMTTRLTKLLSIGALSEASVGGTRTFVSKREGDREQPALYMAENGKLNPAPIIDPLTYGERAALDWYFPSPRGTYVAFGISTNGDERSTLHILDVVKGTVLTERIGQTKWTNLAWLNDETGFFYARYPRPGEANYDEKNQDSYFQRIYFHALGTDDAKDPLVYATKEGTDFPQVEVSDDDRYLTLSNFRGWSASDVYVFDRGAAKKSRLLAPDDKHPWVTVVAGLDALTTGAVHNGVLYLQTNIDAPRYRLLAVPVAKATDRAAWKVLIPEQEGSMESWTIAGDHHVIHYVENVRSKVRVFELDGRASGEVPFPSIGSVASVSGDPNHPEIAIVFSAYAYPPTLFQFDLLSDKLEIVDQVKTDIDWSTFTVEQVRVASKDGTEIPVTIVAPKHMAKDGNNPVLLTGYGGFNVSLLPGFSRSALYWIQRGGVYAVANLRGGGEFGETWHRAGNLGNKEKVFEDFEAVIRWFSSSKISNPSRIGITGGSNGGLLMAAMITRCPDAFQATETSVGLYDMLRYHKFPPAELWVSEYGSADDAAQFPWLNAYSPYHHVKDGTAYPAILVETADHDSRVFWGHSTKFTARLQEATSSDRPVLFYMERDTGHGAGKRLSDLVQSQVRRYAFMEKELGVAP